MAHAKVFRIDMAQKALSPLKPLRLKDIGARETRDLESWLAGAGDEALGRKMLWLARQDQASHQDRSDLVGIDEHGSLIVAELKVVEVDESAITQALVYASTYKDFDKARLAELWFDHSKKTSTALLSKTAKSIEEAEVAIDALISSDGDDDAVSVNDSQTVLLVGPSFSARCLAVCDYLTASSAASSLSFECWQVKVVGEAAQPFLVIDSVFPPPNTKSIIEERREAARDNKYARDPERRAIAASLVALLGGQTLGAGELQAYSGHGGVYKCKLWISTWPEEALFETDAEWGWIYVPSSLGPPDAFEDAVVEDATGKSTGGKYFSWPRKKIQEDTRAAADAVLRLLGALAVCVVQPAAAPP